MLHLLDILINMFLYLIIHSNLPFLRLELAQNNPKNTAVPDDGYHEDQGETEGPDTGGDGPRI